jgi:hypothetical protein
MANSRPALPWYSKLSCCRPVAGATYITRHVAPAKSQAAASAKDTKGNVNADSSSPNARELSVIGYASAATNHNNNELDLLDADSTSKSKKTETHPSHAHVAPSLHGRKLTMMECDYASAVRFDSGATLSTAPGSGNATAATASTGTKIQPSHTRVASTSTVVNLRIVVPPVVPPLSIGAAAASTPTNNVSRVATFLSTAAASDTRVTMSSSSANSNAISARATSSVTPRGDLGSARDVVQILNDERQVRTAGIAISASPTNSSANNVSKTCGLRTRRLAVTSSTADGRKLFETARAATTAASTTTTSAAASTTTPTDATPTSTGTPSNNRLFQPSPRAPKTLNELILVPGHGVSPSTPRAVFTPKSPR